MSEKSSATGIDGNQADDSRSNSGAAYVFAWVGGWVQQAYIKASNADELEFFGSAVALSADGNTLAVGAKTEDSDAIGIGGAQDSNGSDRSGAVYMYARADGRWTQNAYVKASNTGSGDRFGSAVALSADASVLAVAAPEESSRATGIGGDQENDEMALAGAVYLY
jgi:AICAR transformylase/IMP cyclohydrolase PurH